MPPTAGMKVTLVDPEKNPGGVCVYRGCIPSKALLHVANVITESSHAADFGVDLREADRSISTSCATSRTRSSAS